MFNVSVADVCRNPLDDQSANCFKSIEIWKILATKSTTTQKLNTINLPNAFQRSKKKRVDMKSFEKMNHSFTRRFDLRNKNSFQIKSTDDLQLNELNKNGEMRVTGK